MLQEYMIRMNPSVSDSSNRRNGVKSWTGKNDKLATFLITNYTIIIFQFAIEMQYSACIIPIIHT